MPSTSSLTAGACVLVASIAALPDALHAQPRRDPATFPAQQRQLQPQAVIDRGERLYQANCQFCHGADLRGGDSGGPNLLRSQMVLNDQEGELVGPLIVGGSQTQGGGMMPPIPMPDEDIRALAGYLHAVQASMRRQGNPPAETVDELDILVGDARAGRRYFRQTCASCHTRAEMRAVAARFPEPKDLQNHWIRGREGRRRGAPPTTLPLAIVTAESGEAYQGQLLRYDDFFVALRLPDGARKSFTRRNGQPRIDIDDPAAAHLELLPKYEDSNIHDVTAYLVTLK